jgi:hypothetical protein
MSWAVVKLDWDFPPYLTMLNDGSSTWLKPSIQTSDEQIVVGVKYEYQQQDQAPESESILRLYGINHDDQSLCLLQEQPTTEQLVLPADTQGKFRLSIVPKSISKSGLEYFSDIIQLGEASTSINPCAVTLSLSELANADSDTSSERRIFPKKSIFNYIAVDSPQPGILDITYAPKNSQNTRAIYQVGLQPVNGNSSEIAFISSDEPRLRFNDLQIKRNYLVSINSCLPGDSSDICNDSYTRALLKSNGEIVELIEDLSSPQLLPTRLESINGETGVNLSASRVDPTSIELFWPASDHLAIYHLEMSVGDSDSFQPIGFTSPGANFYKVNGLLPDFSYKFRTKACFSSLSFSGNCSPYSQALLVQPDGNFIELETQQNISLPEVSTPFNVALLLTANQQLNQIEFN